MANYYGTAGNETITGGSDADAIYGYAGDDILNGGAGNDELDGGTGNDIMTGGAGDDIYYVDSSGDVVLESAGGGTDTVRMQVLTYTLPSNVEILDTRYAYGGPIYATGNGLANIFIMGWGAVSVDGAAGNDTASYMNYDTIVTVDLATGEKTGAASDDTLTSIENLTGGTADDVLRGTSGANILDGGAGADILVGRAGSDVYWVDDAGDQVIENAGEGNDEVKVRAGTLTAFTLPDNVELLTFIGSGNFTGTGNALNNTITGSNGSDWLYGLDGSDYLIGNSGVDHLYGGNGADTIDGGGGADFLYGGDGNDVYIIGNVGDQIFEAAGEGIDIVYVSIASFALPEHVENLTANASGIDFTLDGNDLDNAITGGGGNDLIMGETGNDVVNGGTGDDILQGNEGDDLLIGGWGQDYMGGGPGADVFKFSSYESGTAAAADFINDFTPGEDRIDLTGVDANIWMAGDQAFAFIGADDFSGTAGELRYAFDESGNAILQADVNGDGVSDFDITLQGVLTPTSSDFML
ncbi:MAG: calcium-binding protein [Allosphingosinicella sp.]